MENNSRHLLKDSGMKKFVKKNRDGTILFKSQKELNQYIRQKVDQYSTINKDTFGLAILLSLEALHLEFGFGDTRLSRFLKHVYSDVECIADEWVKYSDLQKEYEHIFKMEG